MTVLDDAAELHLTFTGANAVVEYAGSRGWLTGEVSYSPNHYVALDSTLVWQDGVLALSMQDGGRLSTSVHRALLSTVKAIFEAYGIAMASPSTASPVSELPTRRQQRAYERRTSGSSARVELRDHPI